MEGPSAADSRGDPAVVSGAERWGSGEGGRRGRGGYSRGEKRRAAGSALRGEGRRARRSSSTWHQLPARPQTVLSSGDTRRKRRGAPCFVECALQRGRRAVSKQASV